MVTESIFRPPTDIERNEMKIVGEKDITYHFRKKNVAKEGEYTKNHKPYCFRCAKVDFEVSVSEAIREKRLNTDEDKEIDVDKIYKVNLDKYGNEDRFELVRTKPINEDKLIDGIRNSVLTGYALNYVCKERGCKNSVFVPLKTYEERQKSKPVKPSLESNKST